ncbi:MULTISPECIES: TonB-dependent receptor [Rhodanobacter]|uniref:TonB-dependent receptor n=1 Tax=Rhodanobacter denitrificans TaxID=666685 RepID=M4NKG0_9GAMM|nr:MULTISPECIES: TonB-dependent receptor [Rhodanobacter]AGG90168.1 TonB-dependent receptor [Rhodanobacter denitrificans]KZC18848.1 TonB-dependent receptor [Rhodanobacter denitrificans]UJJ50265.1 TonB-dependent receptor [Rhodanobacter denitrificans]UJJ57544.1 TonB-dependent receptor [Rhodanobacter denitrificans]UJM85556.1 TonB-dependent receptor [Rhodanobacter denitrificans]
MVLKHNMLAMAIASVCFGMCGAAYAATAPAAGPQQSTQDQAPTTSAEQSKKDEKDKHKTQMQAVEVNGFISSIENSTALKRNASTIVEAVSAEQVGKLPGVSIADTLGRLPGLAVQTLNGRPQVLTIHGLGPDFSTALVNGGQQVSTSNNRDVQFDQYPSSWFDNVVVHLSPSANLIGQGLSGTVDMHTIRPLEKSGPEAAVNAKYIWNSMSELAPGKGVSNKGYNLNGVWVNQFADHTVGVTLGVDLENNPTQIQHQGPWGYPSDSNGDAVIGGSKNFGITDSMKRNGALATVQWQPNEHYTGTIDLTYDNFKEVQQAKGMEFPLWWSSAQLQPGGVVIPDPHVSGGGFVQSGTYANVTPVIRNDYNSTSAGVTNFNWENKFTINENWTINANANYSRATRRDVNLESYSGTGYNKTGATDTVGFNELGNGMLFLNPSLDYTNGVVLTDPQGWGAGSDVVQAGFINAPRTVDSLANVRIAVERSFASGPFSSMEFGVSNSRRNKSYHIDQSFLTLGGGTISGGSAVTTAAIQGGSSCDPLSWMGVGSQLCYNPFALIGNGSLANVPTFGSNTGTPPDWKTHENVFTPYVQFNIDTQLGGVSLRGNFGIQAQRTSQRASGERVAPDSATTGNNIVLIPVTGSTSYTRYLPSANLIFGFTDNDDLRVSAARTLARPRMDQMNAGLGVSGDNSHLQSTDPNQAYFSAKGGNPKLRPTMADNFNVSYEHYFSGGNSYQCNSADQKNSDLCRSGGGGYFSVSGYFIGLHDYINPNASFLYDFSPFLPFKLSAQQLPLLGTPYGIVTGPTNDGRGYVKGLQGTLNLPFNLIAQPLDGFGVILTGNRTKSSLVYPGNPTPITVPGLSKWVANATLYYQHNGFEARISDNYRSNFLGEVSGISATRVEQTLRGGSSYDAQVSYTFDSGSLKGLTLIAQGSNLSNKIFTTFQNNDPRQVQTWERYGRTYSLGASYKFQ